MPHHKEQQSARIEARSTLIREFDGGNVRRPEGKYDTKFFGGVNPLESGRAADPGIEGGDVKAPILGGIEGAHVDGNDDTIGHGVPRVV